MKKMIQRSALMVATTLAAVLASAQSSQKQKPIYFGPQTVSAMTDAAKQQLFSRYCVGQFNSTDIPKPNYQSPDVLVAVKQMSTVAPSSYYFYPPILHVYGLGTKDAWNQPPADAPKGITTGSHAFLVQLCAEFRDRPTMIQEKINWLKNLYKLPFVDQTPIDPAKNIWSQLSAKSFSVYSSFTGRMWYAKQAEMSRRGLLTIKIGSYDVDAPVEPLSVCETKNIMVNYISNPQYVGNDGQAKLYEYMQTLNDPTVFQNYMIEYRKFAKKNCTPDDRDSVYDYRGDKNFKHNSPESNGMIWAANSIASHCYSPSQARKNDQFVKDADCQNYFKNPFASRWMTARSGLATWLFRDQKYDQAFRDPMVKVVMCQSKDVCNFPFSFKIPNVADSPVAEYMPQWQEKLKPFYQRPDIGFNELVGAGPGKQYNAELAYERLRDAVNRHTNWYQSGFDDEMGWTMEQVYSPYVASSHVMEASNGFSFGGDGRHAWMFIFKVKKSHLRNSTTVLNKIPVDFDRDWFDETSLGTEAGVYAKNERALDRLGTAIEGEFDSILYLHNVEGDDGLNGPDGANVKLPDSSQQPSGIPVSAASLFEAFSQSTSTSGDATQASPSQVDPAQPPAVEPSASPAPTVPPIQPVPGT